MRIYIYGSCVSRDIISFDNECTIQLTNYIARSPLASVMSIAPKLNVNIEGNQSAFQRRMIAYDLEKKLLNDLMATKFDILLMDLIDERINLIKTTNSGIAAYSNELQATGYRFKEQDGVLISSGGEESFNLWNDAWIRFCEFAKKHGFFEKIIITELYWATGPDGECAPGYNKNSIDFANKWLSRAYSQIRRDLNEEQIIQVPKELIIADPCHTWGFSPFHYIKNYYNYMSEVLARRSDRDLMMKKSTIALGGESGLIRRKKISNHGIDFLGITNSTNFSIVIKLESEVPDPVKLIACFGEIDSQSDFVLRNKLTKSHLSKFGYYRYLSKTSDKEYVAEFFCDPGVLIEFFLYGYNCEEEIVVSYFEFNGIELQKNERLNALISVDVEALPGRAKDNLTETLVFGKTSVGEYGIRRLCEIFNDYKIKATFFVEVIGSKIYGDEYLYNIKNILNEYNQEIGLHVHPELIKYVNHPQNGKSYNSFQDIDYEDALNILSESINIYSRVFDSQPTLFRPGGMKVSIGMYKACRELGLYCVSGIFRGYWKKLQTRSTKNGCFKWENDIVEVPLDLALDPLKNFWIKFNDLIIQKRSSQAKFNFISLLIHSWSLLPRDESGCHNNYSENYENILRKYLECLTREHKFITHGEAFRLFNQAVVVPNKKAEYIVLEDNMRIQFKASTRIQWKKVSEDYAMLHSDFISAVCLPLPKVDPTCIHYFSDGNTICPVYIKNNKAIILPQRLKLKNLSGLFYLILQFAPESTIVANKLIIDYFPKNSETKSKNSGETYYLYLPKTVDQYRASISKNLRYEIERESRKHQLDGQSFSIEYIEGERLSYERYIDAFHDVNFNLERKGAKGHDEARLTHSYEVYKNRGLLVELIIDQRRMAVGFFLMDNTLVHYTAGATCDKSMPDKSRSISYGKILLYYAIQLFINRGYSCINLGGGDYGYKSRFGGVIHPLQDIEYKFQQDSNSAENTAFRIFDGFSINAVEKYYGQRVESIYGYDYFEKFLDVDFVSEKNSAFGLDPLTNKGYTPAIDSAIYGLLDLLPNEVKSQGFCDIGCGKGKALYYAKVYNFSRYLGIEISKLLSDIARKNLDFLGLNDVEVLNKSATEITIEDARFIGVYFMYNPFSRDVMVDFAKLLIKLASDCQKLVYVCYLNSLYDDVFLSLGFDVYAKKHKGTDQWRFDTSTIFRFDPLLSS